VAGTTTITVPSSTATLATNENFTSTGIDDNATSTAITIDSSENVGIGVTPEANWRTNRTALQVAGLGAMWGDATAGVSGELNLSNNVYMDNTSGDDYYIINDQASKISMQDGNFYFKNAAAGTADTEISWTTAMTIENDGDIYAPNSSGSTHIALKYNSGSNPWILVNGTSTASTTKIEFRNANGVVGTIQTSGSSTSYNTSSDYRLKENVVPMTGSIDRVKALKPSRFNFIADPDTTVDGFLAHEAQEVVPEAISGEKDAMTTEEYEVTPAVKDENDNIVTEAVMGTREVPDMQGIDQSKLVALLVGAIQEQQTLIESLQADIAILKGATI